MYAWHRSLRRLRWPALCGVLFLSPVAHSAGPVIPELRPRFDDVFGTAADYQRALDRFAELSASMGRVCDDFARAVQETLAEVRLIGAAGPSGRQQACPQQVARSYARAQALGQEYLRIGRELSRHHDLVRELDRLGDTARLTPDYRARVRQTLKGYESLLAGYREMKATFHESLGEELRFVGCDPGQLLAQAQAPDVPAAPAPHAPAAPPAALPERPQPAILFYVDNSRCPRRHLVYLDGKQIGEVDGTARGAFHSTLGPHELCLISDKAQDPPGTRVAAAGEGAQVRQVFGAPRPGALPEGEAPAAAPAEAPHSPCAPAALRRGYFHDGWTIALRCE